MHKISAYRRRRLLVGAALIALALADAAAAAAQDRATLQVYDLKPQDLRQALAAAAKVSGREVMAPDDLVAGKTAPALHGDYTPDQAFAALLAGSHLKLTPVGDLFVLQPARGPQALGESQAGDADSLSEIVVTGTRIRGAAPVGSNLIAITRRDIERSGYATTQQLVQALPQNFGGGANETTYGYNNRGNALNNAGLGAGVNLRGLGTDSTLVLINGTRPALGGVAGLFADVSTLPASAIERVEVLADGASALYGSDAVGGVVNFVMRDRFEGRELRARYASADGDFPERQISAVWGARLPRGHVLIAYEYYARGRLAADDRAYAREDLRAFGGADNRGPFAAPGTILAGGQTYAIPSGQNGVGLTPGQLAAGQVNRADQQVGTDLIPRQRRHTAYLSADQALDDKTKLFAQVLAADRRFSRRYVGALQYTASVPSTNPFYVDPVGTGDPIDVQHDFRGDLGAPRHSGHVQAYNATGAVTRQLGAWSATAQAGAGRQREAWRYDNSLNTYRLGLALAQTDPARAYNLLGDPGSTPASVVDTVRGFERSLGVYTVQSASLRADGPLFNLPAGPIRAALGAEWRRERYRQTSQIDLYGEGPETPATPYPDARKIAAAYVEARVPLINPTMGLAAARRLEVSLAARIERYSDVGTTRNPKIGVDWTPLEGMTLKGSYGKSFRAPSFQDLQTGPGLTFYQPVDLPDPRSPTGQTTTLALVGNSPDIGPERATTWSLGFELRPASAPGLRIAAGYFDIAYRDRIANVNADAFNLLIERETFGGVITDNPAPAVVAAYYASPDFYNPQNIAASDIAAIVDLRTRNLSRLDENGVDLDASYTWTTGLTQWSVGLAGDYILGLKQQVTATAPATEVVGTVGRPARLRLRASAAWTRGAWSAAGFVNFVDGYQNQLVVPARHVEAWTTADVQLSYVLPERAGAAAGLKVSLSANNVFDRDPPFAEIRSVTSAIGYDGEKASPMGRLIAIEVARQW